jgi:nucleotide-binding universal stress UspA family protein
MEEFRRILVGVDLALSGDVLTPGSTRAVDQALQLAGRARSELVFLHSTWADLHEEDQAIRPGPSPAGQRVLEELVERARADGLTARLVLARDRAWLEIIRAVQRGEADVVLVARRNQAGGGAALGGVTRKLMRKCPAPVWVVKPEGRSELRIIAGATDLSGVGDLAVTLAARLAALFGAELDVVHAWPVPLSVPVLPELDVPQHAHLDVEQHETAVRARFETNLARLSLPAAPRTHLVCGAPSSAIRAIVERRDADLLVMGTVSRGGIAGLLLGNTAERLLDHVQCSWLTIKPRDFESPVRPVP